jgi:hypothetical protein
MSANLTQTISIDDFQIGRRYIETIPGFEHAWTVKSIERREAKIQVLRNGKWVTPMLVTVTYVNDRSITEETGTEIAVNLVA